MTAEETAKNLVELFAETIPHIEYGVLIERDWTTAKECALVAVEEIINIQVVKNGYWNQVKNEITKL